MTTHSNYSLQNFSTNNAKVLTGNSQPVPDFTLHTVRVMRLYDFLWYLCGALFKKMFRGYVSMFVSCETVHGSM